MVGFEFTQLGKPDQLVKVNLFLSNVMRSETEKQTHDIWGVCSKLDLITEIAMRKVYHSSVGCEETGGQWVSYPFSFSSSSWGFINKQSNCRQKVLVNVAAPVWATSSSGFIRDISQREPYFSLPLCWFWDTQRQTSIHVQNNCKEVLWLLL